MFQLESVLNTCRYNFNQMITLTCDGTSISSCSSVVIVPEIALQEPGYIKALTSGAGANAKHEFHALAQMAYFQYQDDELEIDLLKGTCRILKENNDETLESGLVIYRSGDGTIHIASHGDVNCKKLLEAANRYCTRWVRLDI
jgi:hypothetical protein